VSRDIARVAQLLVPMSTVLVAEPLSFLVGEADLDDNRLRSDL